MKFYVYILLCSDGTYYTGWTTNVNKRVAIHNKGKGAKYTRGRLPVELVWEWEYPSKSMAMRQEYFIKQRRREEKDIMVAVYKAKNFIAELK